MASRHPHPFSFQACARPAALRQRLLPVQRHPLRARDHPIRARTRSGVQESLGSSRVASHALDCRERDKSGPAIPLSLTHDSREVADARFGDGTWFAAIGDHTRDRYLDFPYARGAAGEVDFLAKVLAVPEGGRVLDVACGVARHSTILARHRDWSITGADISRGLLQTARERAAAAGASITFVRSDARALPFGPVFDAAFSVCEGAFGLLGSDAEHARFLRSMARILKPGGRFILSTMNAFHFAAHDDAFDPLTNVCIDHADVKGHDGTTRTFTVPTRAFTPREVATLLSAAGFRILHVYGGTSGDYGEHPLQWDDPEALFVAERR